MRCRGRSLRASMSQTVTLQVELLYDIGASAAFVAVRYALLRIPSSVLIWLREAYELCHSKCTNSRGRVVPFHSVAGGPPSFESHRACQLSRGDASVLDAGTSVALVGDGDGCDPTVQRLPIRSSQHCDPRLLPRPDY